MKFTAKHFYNLAHISKNLLNKESLDVSRINEKSPFHIPNNRDDWIKKGGQNPWLPDQAKTIVDFLKKEGVKKIISIGVGGAWLEYYIKKLYPQLHLTCSDCTPKAMERLKKNFIECDVIEEFDILKGQWKENVFYLFYRVDTDLTKKQWKEVFSEMRRVRVKNILFIPSVLLTPKVFLRELKSYWRQKLLKNKPFSFVGYMRTKDALKELWKGDYKIKKEIQIKDSYNKPNLVGFLLEKI